MPYRFDINRITCLTSYMNQCPLIHLFLVKYDISMNIFGNIKETLTHRQYRIQIFKSSSSNSNYVVTCLHHYLLLLVNILTHAFPIALLSHYAHYFCPTAGIFNEHSIPIHLQVGIPHLYIYASLHH